MKKLRYIFIFVFGLFLALTGCQTQRIKTLNAKKVQLSMNVSGKQINANSSLRVVTDSCIVLSVNPILGMEIVRLELTPQQVCVIDKVNRRYATLTYPEVRDLLDKNPKLKAYKNQINYTTLQKYLLRYASKSTKKRTPIVFQASDLFNVELALTFLQVEMNQPLHINPTNLIRYNQVSIDKMLSL